MPLIHIESIFDANKLLSCAQRKKMKVHNRLVFIVEDDASMRMALEGILNTSGYRVSSSSSAEEFLGNFTRHCSLGNQLNDGQTACCVLMDVGLGGMTGIEAQSSLKKIMPEIPVVFMSGAADAQSVNRAWRDGAYDFIFKPFQTTELLSLVERACEKFKSLKMTAPQRDRASDAAASILDRAKALTGREAQVIRYIAEGNKNQTIADALGISLRTVKMHRANLMRKLSCTHVAELVKFYERMRRVSQ